MERELVMKTKSFILLFAFLLSSCSFSRQNKEKFYLNYFYTLNDCGDIHEYSPTYGEVLKRDPGFTSYTSLFNKNSSYINFQCYGDSFNTYYCETTFCLVDKNNNYVFGNDTFKFRTSFSGGQIGELIFEDEEIANFVGKIYVYTPYWCRWQYEYDVNNDGNKTLLTFEFWKRNFNELPEWSAQ